MKDCDYILLAADSMRARLVFNSLVHQYLIPRVQVGAKVVSDRTTGAVRDVYSVVRLVTPESGCLWCNCLVNPATLLDESISDGERRTQAYVDDAAVVAPSVITLNGLAGAQAVNDFSFYITGLTADDVPLDYVRFRPCKREVLWDEPRAGADYTECGLSSASCYANGGRALVAGQVRIVRSTQQARRISDHAGYTTSTNSATTRT